MPEEKLQTIELKDDFYRDGIGKLLAVSLGICTIIFALIATSFYIYFTKPAPVIFPVYAEWRVQADVPLEQPYLSVPDLLQWVSNVLPNAFKYDFTHYNDQLKEASQYFTPDGWKVFLDQLNNYANYNNVQASKLFVNAVPTGAPYLVNQGLLSGRYAWWVQMPLDISYAGYQPPASKRLTLQVLVVRVSTLNNLSGVGINNVIVV